MSEITDRPAIAGGNVKLLGVITIILGMLAIATPLLTGFSIVLLVGLLVVAGGFARMVWAFRADSLGGGLFGFTMGGLTLLCGVALATDPLMASGVLTIILAGYLVLDGVIEVAAAFRVRPAPGWGCLLAGGILSAVLGVMIWQQFPLAGAWAIGVLLGFKLLLVGITIMSVGPVTQVNA